MGDPGPGLAVQSSSTETQPVRSLERKEKCGYPSHVPADVFTKAKNKSSDCHLELLNIQTEDVAAIREETSLLTPQKHTNQHIPLTKDR